MSSFFGNECIGSGIAISNYKSACQMNNDLKSMKNINSDQDYRLFLQRNGASAVESIEKQYTATEGVCGCNKVQPYKKMYSYKVIG